MLVAAATALADAGPGASLLAAEAPTPADPASGGDDERFTRDPSEVESPTRA